MKKNNSGLARYEDSWTDAPTQVKTGDSSAPTVNALLVYPLFPITYWGFQHGLRLIGKKASLPPLGLLTVAALLPKHWRIRMVDLNVRALHDKELQWANVVLTGGMLIQVESIQDVIARAHRIQIPVVVGGPAATTDPKLFIDADIVFRGEAEERIDELISALSEPNGVQRVLDAPTTYPAMKSVPPPRFDLLDISKYVSMSLQYSRGCPFRCEFCDVIEIFGRTPRTKDSDQMLSELESLYRLGYRGSVFIVDDNFIGNKCAVRRLLPKLCQWQRSRKRPFELYTEASVNLASDPRLLSDMVDAGFSSVFLGIETPVAKSLEQTGKVQNLRIDLSEAVDRITRAGIEVMGGFIVGFDSDDENVFSLQREFLSSQPIPLAMAGILTALPGTALWRRLDAEGRLRARSNGDQFCRPNFVPMMEERALLKGYADLIKWLYLPKAYYKRCEAYLKRLGPHRQNRRSAHGEIAALLRTFWYIGVVSPRRHYFWRLTAKAALRGRDWVREAIACAIRGEHLIRYTREYVLPRLERAIAEIQAEADLGGELYRPHHKTT